MLRPNSSIISMIENQNILWIENLYKSYGDKLILDNVDLTVNRGEFCTLVGPSGCGKSTLLRLILGQEAADKGLLKINNNQVEFPDPERGIVFQRYSLYPNLTVLENVLLGKNLTKKKWFLPWFSDKQDLDEAMHYLNVLRLTDSANKHPHELSGGMQQRVAIAQALIMKPPILLMDEPFGALDPDTREELQVFLLELWDAEELTIFFVTHDLEEACYLGSRMLVLSQYYQDDRGDVNRGAKIVADYQLPSVALSTEIKTSKTFQDLISTVRSEGFDPEVQQHVKHFNLEHPDSFQTLLNEEHSNTDS